MVNLQSELCNLRTKFEESLNSHEDAKRRLSVQVREFSQQREHAQQEVRNKGADLSTQLCTTEMWQEARIVNGFLRFVNKGINVSCE